MAYSPFLPLVRRCALLCLQGTCIGEGEVEIEQEHETGRASVRSAGSRGRGA